MTKREESNGLFKELFKVVPVYEEDNMMCYSGGNTAKNVFGEAAKDETTAKYMTDLKSNMKNPVEWMYWWCRGEIYDIKAIQQAIEQRDNLEKAQIKAKQKVADLREDLEKITQGKSSMRTVFKGSNDTAQYEMQIDSLDREIENLGNLYDIVSIHLARDAIPALKKRKLKIYQQMLQSFGIAEIGNAHLIASFWNKIIENKYVVREQVHMKMMKENALKQKPKA